MHSLRLVDNLYLAVYVCVNGCEYIRHFAWAQQEDSTDGQKGKKDGGGCFSSFRPKANFLTE